MTVGLSREEAFEVLNGLPAIGPVSLNRLLDSFGHDPIRIFEASRVELSSIKGVRRPSVDTLLDWRTHFNLSRASSTAVQMGAEFVSRESTRYPRLLKEISDPPIGFYCLGNYDFSKPQVAMVGSRKVSAYGKAVAESFARDLASVGVCVVSGMARGIDTYSHRGALLAKSGSTVAVLGCGLNIVYPPENLDVYRSVQENGAVISEFPFGRNADKQTFPMRNRLVSGMSEAVIVVESDVAGGSMITARFAGEQGRILFAVPGRIDQRTSKGCNQLIRDGAILLSSVDELLEELRYNMVSTPMDDTNDEATHGADLSDLESAILKTLRGGEAYSVDELASKFSLSVGSLSSTLMMMELDGHIAKRLDGKYEASVRVG
ncbi:DNA-processing protein DprA [Puniceicoccaceae bacterium K14]|nr:DNA-processing protein DprA [Puniceicoccaceae bacterium K14]